MNLRALKSPDFAMFRIGATICAMWHPWQLAPDSDPEQRYILVSEDGEEEHPKNQKYNTYEEAEKAAIVANKTKEAA